MAKKFLTGLNLVVLDADPATGSEGELYFNSSASVAKIYQAGSWSVLGAGGGGGAITVSTTEPASPNVGDAWYKNDTGEFYVYDGTYWVEVNGVIEGLSQEQVQDYVAPLFTSSTNSNVISTYDDINNVINLNTSGSLVSIDSITYPDYITFDTTPEIEPADPGSLWWSTDFETLNLQLDAGVDLQIGQEHLVRVKNSSGLVAIPKGTAVMFAGAAGDTVEATPAVSTADSEPELLIGITAEIIPADGFGFVTQFGFINGTDTETPGWSLGNLLYVDSENPGQLTNVKPSPPNWTFPIAAVTRINSNSGRILVRAIPGKHLHDIVDVLISGSVQNNELLAYDLSTNLWINQTAAEAGLSESSHNHTLDSLSNVEINSLSNLQSLVWNSASGAWVNQLISGGEGGGGATTTVSETAPAEPVLGDTWYKQSTGSFLIYDGTYWIEVNGIIDGLTEDQVQDYASTLFTHSNHSNITATYDDTNGEIILTSSAAQDLTPYLTQSSASSIYLTQINASTIYATQVDLDNIDALPSQTGNAGNYLTTDGSVASWGTLDLSLYLTQSSASTTYATTAALDSINGESDQFILPGQIFG
jgi:hypothetical protein